MTRMLVCVLLPLSAACWFLNDPENAFAACALCTSIWVSVLIMGPKERE